MFQVVVGDADLRGHVPAEVRVDDVADPHEVFEDLPVGRVREVEPDAPLVAVEHLEEEAVFAALVGRDVTPDVSPAAGVLDLDHLSAEVGEVHASERSGAVLLHGEDANVCERFHREVFLVVSMRRPTMSAMMWPAFSPEPVRTVTTVSPAPIRPCLTNPGTAAATIELVGSA